MKEHGDMSKDTSNEEENQETESLGRDAVPAPENPCRVVGIGAAAGGQDALEQFFTAMPADCELTFVVIMHLPPEGPSFLPEMLGRYTPMNVLSVEEGMDLQPNTVYVISAGRELVLSDGRFRLETPADGREGFHPIDRFFRSLAEEVGDRAMAMVFSGRGTDGAAGVKAVKEAGGTVIIQDPDSAIHPDMPRNAIAGGVADLILPGEKLAEQVARIAHVVCSSPPQSCLTTTLDDELAAVFTLVKSRTGHDFSSYKRNTIVRRIERRMTANEVTGMKKYLALLETNAQETRALAQDILIGVTSFFRDPEAFEVLRREIIPRLFANRDSDEPVRIWHACCATGEEVYSTAILIREYLDEQQSPAKVQLFATDIDEIAIAQARAGLYSDDIAPDVGEGRLKAFFTRTDGRWRVIKQLREMVVFAHHNLIKDPPFFRLDLLVCRNFLIYLNSDMQKRLIPLFHLALKPHGVLFLGSAEVAENTATLFSPIDKKWKIFERREGGRCEDLFFPFAAPVCRFPRSELAPRPAFTNAPTPEQLAGKFLMERYSPPCVVVNQKYEMVHVFSGANRFFAIPAGEPTRDILRLAREELRPALRAAIYKAFSELKQVSFRGIKVLDEGGEIAVDVLAEPLNAPPPAEKLAIVILEPALFSAPCPTLSAGEDALSGDETSKDRLIRQLEEQLRVTHEQLLAVTEQLETSQEGFMSANEELMSINEEFQSANEELQSTNEELETSKEELQALNEELATVNVELQGKVEEINQVNSDLKNLLTSSGIATLFLDRQLTIRLFSPAMADIFNLIPADVGRPFRHLTGTVDWTGLSEAARTVLASLATVEREVAAPAGDGHFLMRVFPYQTSEGSVDGIVVTFIDITERKQTEEKVRNVALFPEENPWPVLRAGEDGVLRFANRAAAELLAQWRCAVGGTVPDFVRRELETALKSRTNRELEILCGERCFSLVLVPIAERGYVNFYGSDITARNRAVAALRESEERLRLFIGHAPASLAMFDREMRYLSVSRRWLSDYGLGARDLIGESHYDVFPEIPEEWREAHRRGLAGEVLMVDVDRFERANGSVQWLRWEIHPWFDVSGKAGGIVIFTEDVTERQLAEKALRESEARYRELVQNANSAIIRWSRDGTITFFNEYAQKLFGWSADEAIGKHANILLPERDSTGADLTNLTQDIVAHPDRYVDNINENVRRDGRRVWMNWSNRAIYDEHGQIAGILTVGSDITERKLAEDALRESEQRLARAQEIAHLGSWELDLRKNELTWSEEVYRIFGLHPRKDNATYQAFLDRVHPEDRTAVDAAYTNSLREGRDMYEIEHRIVRPGTNETRWVQERCQHVRDMDGNVFRSIGMILDITERKRAAERQDLLAQTTSKLLASDAPQEVIDTLCRKVMVYLDCQVFFNFLADHKHGRLRLNACAGIPEAEQAKIEWLDYGIAICGCAARDGCRIVAENIPNTPDPRTELVKSYGIQAYACHPLMAHGEVIGTLSFGTRTRSCFSEEDLALMKAVSTHVSIAIERKRAEEELLNAKAAAEASTRAKGQFLANMSHELRTPMTGVLGMLDLALGGELSVEQRKNLETVKKSAYALLRILNDILDFSRIEAGMITLVEEPFPLHKSVSGAVELFELEARRKGLNLTLDIAPATPSMLKGDEGRIRQLLINLIGNAVKFTERGEVTLRVTAGDATADGHREITFTVTDTGIGISEEKQKVLFQPFSQGDASHTRRFGGTGLGLAISREVVERMGGTISFTSEPGLGSTFVVTLPLREPARESAEETPAVVRKEAVPASVPVAVATKPRLLVAEDNPVIRDILGIMLRQAGIDFDPVVNGKEAVERWAGGNYDLILMDVQMPLMDGFEAVHAIREQEKERGGHIPIIALTAHAYRTDQQKCFESGMDAYVAKPFNFQKLFALIKELIGNRAPERGTSPEE